MKKIEKPNYIQAFFPSTSQLIYLTNIGVESRKRNENKQKYSILSQKKNNNICNGEITTAWIYFPSEKQFG